jgi:sterol desaturase/sphingolipid hydroxylase (fatty acid hydroxylase superfamily)
MAGEHLRSFVLTNLALSFSSAYLAGFTVRNGLGLFPLLGISLWTQTVLGVLALDLFGYFAHVLLHKSWLGWQFHRVHHSESAVDVTTAFRQHPWRNDMATAMATSRNRCFRYSSVDRDCLSDPVRAKCAVGTCQHQT